MRCLSCGSDNPEGVKFCIECATPFMLRCLHCGSENLARAKFCGECAAPLARQSSAQRLASSVPTGSGFNVQGSTLPSLGAQPPAPNIQPPISYTPKHLAERLLAEREALETRGAANGERKTITALFADIKGSMDLIEPLDPEEARAIIDPALHFMMDAVHRYDGFVAQSTGDGVFALFGAPIACEDHPQRAIYAALRMQEEGKRFAERLRLEKGLNFQIRVGLNTGEMVLRSIRKDDLHTDYTPIGHSTSLAARMENLATPGSIVVSEHTHKLVDGYFDFKSLGAARVKGVSEPIRIYEVLGIGPLRTRLQVAVRRGLARFVGRQREMDQLRQAIEQTRTGHGQIVGVMGEPGVGKSRLFHEFKLFSHKDCLVLETFSVSHGKAYPYLPLIDLLKNYFQITLQDDERKRRERIGGKVLMLDRSLEDTLPYLFALLGIAEPNSLPQEMDPQIRKRRTLEAIKRLLVRESLNQPLILVFEDLHWLDAETQDFLTLLSEGIATAKILLLVNYRPEYRHEWGSKTFYTQLRLDPLGQAEAGELLTALLGDGAELQPLKQLILEKTEGNPFFMEEIVQRLREQGLLAVGAHGRAPLPTNLHIPPTVQGVLAARIDRLSMEEKELLQTLSVIGKEFPWSLLKQVINKPEDELHRLLSHLQSAEFIYEQPAFPETEYTFKHALTQEVAYNSLLLERRKILHEHTAQAIEALFHLQLEDHYGELAHHYSRSNTTPKAIEYLRLAGQQAAGRSANVEAVSHFTLALELLKTQPATPQRSQEELILQIALGPALAYSKGFAVPEVEQIYTRARELCRQVGDTPQLFRTILGLRTFYHLRGRPRIARELAEQLLPLAQSAQDSALLVLAHRALGATVFTLGDFLTARSHLEQSLALYDVQQHRWDAALYGQDPGVLGRGYLAWTLWYLGYPTQAFTHIEKAHAMAQELSNPTSVATAMSVATVLHEYRREPHLAQQRGEAAVALGAAVGIPNWSASGFFGCGWALSAQGQVEAGIAQMHEGLVAMRTTGAELQRTHFLALLAEAYQKAGQTDAALRSLAEAFDIVNADGECYHEAELYRIKAELLLTQEIKRQESKGKNQNSESPNTQHLAPSTQAEAEREAEAYFRKAIEIACKQQAKSLELRAVTSLARLWRQQGKKDEARQMLAEIYNWFTEGFDTADLKDAKALLEELEGRATMTSGKKRRSSEERKKRKTQR